MAGPQSWRWADIEPYANNPAYIGRKIPTSGVTIKGLLCAAGAVAPDHAHPYDQWAMVLEGEVTITCGEEPYALQKGSVLHIPAGVVHSALYATECVLLEFGLGVDAA